MQDLKLEITIERPTVEKPAGYVSLVAQNLRPDKGEHFIRCEDAADGPCTQETLQRVLADVWSYFLNGEKAFGHRVQEGTAKGRGRT